jgi:hypothetical protein
LPISPYYIKRKVGLDPTPNFKSTNDIFITYKPKHCIAAYQKCFGVCSAGYPSWKRIVSFLYNAVILLKLLSIIAFQVTKYREDADIERELAIIKPNKIQTYVIKLSNLTM